MGNCSTARHRKVDLQMELSYVSDGGGPMVCLYYDGDPPVGSVGSKLWSAKRRLQPAEPTALGVPDESNIDVFLWDVSISLATDWRKGLEIFGVTDECQLPAVVLHEPSRTYRKATRTLYGAEASEPEAVLQAMHDCWRKHLSDAQWDELSRSLDVQLDDSNTAAKSPEAGSDRPPAGNAEEGTT
mmetsp:Transcript_75906/g.201666  ORF Transcript_75906/g.201666 Transcript_75906/m.201666 type:complete len:185 (-) Transcript_75906:67-621(-)|eukprot:CAMPEP_0171230404 /NCGR_PEP_ID=MMETSP0790-20130122/39379_1 /TAXON_ID=2925 /ORGANISM="Alexandrium catenella, Strain OF101" /LENGTH=184 /DNA_ID=CAMNT_0011696615 /DNA_START=111 /DNA_END=665 /DNA_ORIENTATION=-